MSGRVPWWLENRQRLIDGATSGGILTTPCYVYYQPAIEQSIKELKSMSAVDKVFYAMKANDCEAVLKCVAGQNIGIECVSMAEVDIAMEHVNGQPKRILFTPNFAPRCEYEHALNLGVNLTVDSLYPLQNWPELFLDREILHLMVGHMGTISHDYDDVIPFPLPNFVAHVCVNALKLVADELRCKIVGLHAHAGSGVSNEKHWGQMTSLLLHLRSTVFTEANIINVGGGVMVSEDNQQPQIIDLNQVNIGIKEAKSQLDGVDIWMESGRYVVAEAGVLLTSVTQTVNKGDTWLIGLNTGMNSLIRPALYSARHELYNLSKWEQQQTHETGKKPATVVGPICESSDVFGQFNMPANTEEGDLVLISNCGAYVRTMASTYNARPFSEEVMME